MTVYKGFRCSSTMGTNSAIICEYHFTDFQTDPWGGTNSISPSSQLRSHPGTSGQLGMPAATNRFGNSQTHILGHSLFKSFLQRKQSQMSWNTEGNGRRNSKCVKYNFDQSNRKVPAQSSKWCITVPFVFW